MSVDYRHHGLTPPYLDGPAIGGDGQILHRRAMAASSLTLAKALSDYNRARLRQQMSRDDGMSGRRSEAASGSSLTFLPVRRPCPVATVPSRTADSRPQASGREPCPRCATRGDLGCAHFAPCEPVSA